MVMRRLVWTWLLVVCFVVACSEGETTPLTEVTVVVDTDLTVPSEIDEIRMIVDGPSGATKTAIAKLGAGEPRPPRSLALVHEDGPLEPLKVVVQGRLKSKVVLSREASLAFVEGKHVVLLMHLVRACVDMTCADKKTCSERGCVDIAVDANSLKSWNGSPPKLSSNDPDLDGSMSTPDGSVDNDSSVADGGPADAQMPNDSGTGDGGMCVPKKEICNGLDEDCDMVPDNGIDVNTDPDNCSRCGNVCKAPNRLCCKGVCSKTC